MNIENAFEDGELTDFMHKNQQNNWVDTHFEKYGSITTKDKGRFGESFVEKLFVSKGFDVANPTDTGHDRIIGGFKTEIKFSLAHSPTWKRKNHEDKKMIVPDQFSINHIAIGKDWDRFIFCCINPSPGHNPDRIRMVRGAREYPPMHLYFMEKADFCNYMEHHTCDVFKRQQGGKKGGNDDWFVMGRASFYNLIDLPFVKEVEGSW